MLSMSLGFTTLKSSTTFPSTKIKGRLSPLVETPLILIVEPPPGDPVLVVMFTPATCPCKACSMRVGFNFSIVSELTTDTAPVISFFF